MKQTSQILRQARALIEKPEHWIQGTAAQNIDGTYVSPLDASAIRFCTVGALCRVNPAGSEEQHLLKFMTEPRLSTFNDTHTHSEVLAMFDKAIAEAEKAEAK